MRYGIISDIHGNLAAFEKVNEQLKQLDLDDVWFLGDVVGYGPYPNECIDLLVSISGKGVCGNHDLGVQDRIPIHDFNYEGQRAIEWIKRVINENSLKHLSGYSNKISPVPSVTLVHGSPSNPTWEYIRTLSQVKDNFSHFRTKLCFFGHTHIPVIYESTSEGLCQALEFEKESIVKLNPESKYLVNPGSVGQPRDGDPRAGFSIFDSDKYSLEYIRTPYPIVETQKRMTEVKLPSFLIERLDYGM